MKRLSPGLLGLWILFLTPWPALAAGQGPISVKSELDNAFITIGDPVRYTVTIRHAPTVQILSPIPAPDAEVFKIKKAEDFRREENGAIVEGRIYLLTTYRLGEFVLAPLEIQYRDKNGGEAKTVKTAPIFLTVKSVVRGQPPTDIRGIKAVLPLGVSRTLLIMIASLLALAAAAFFVYRFLQKPKTQITAPQTPLTAEELAFLSLNQLMDSDLLRRGKVKEYYLKLSEILRTYFEARHQILAVESTTYEIMLLLKDKGIDPDLRAKIAEVLEAADLAKFAKWKPDPAQVILINKKSKEIVEESTPREAPRGI